MSHSVGRSAAMLQRWSQIRDDVYGLALLTQRLDALWAWPTSAFELGLNFAPADNPENEIRSRGFGHSSITTSFIAMRAISETVNSLPASRFANCLKAISTFRDIAGGYGSPLSQFHTVEINAVPRHTALGIVANLVFYRLSRSYASPEALKESVAWLLQANLQSGGWAYKPVKRDSKLEFMTTASAVAALCLYLEHCDDPDLAKRISAEVSKAVKLLTKQQKNGVWDGEHANPKAKLTEVRDSAFAIQLLCLANRAGRLDACLDGQSGCIPTLVGNLASKRLSTGWPTSIGLNDPDPAATMWVLQAVADADCWQLLAEDELALIESFILDRFERGSLASATAAFDWYGYLRFASSLAGKLDVASQSTIDERCEQIFAKFKGGVLYRADLRCISARIRSAVDFALGGGAQLKEGPKTLLQEWKDKWKFEISKYFSFGLVGYLIGNLINFRIDIEKIINWMFAN